MCTPAPCMARRMSKRSAHGALPTARRPAWALRFRIRMCCDAPELRRTSWRGVIAHSRLQFVAARRMACALRRRLRVPRRRLGCRRRACLASHASASAGRFWYDRGAVGRSHRRLLSRRKPGGLQVRLPALQNRAVRLGLSLRSSLRAAVLDRLHAGSVISRRRRQGAFRYNGCLSEAALPLVLPTQFL